jgi:phage terminase large subunit-like protein
MIIPPKQAEEMLARYRRDLDNACPVKHCRARRGEPCRDTPAGMVHQSRRVLSLAKEHGRR